jgi:hypothetical protein
LVFERKERNPAKEAWSLVVVFERKERNPAKEAELKILTLRWNDKTSLNLELRADVPKN